MAFTWQNIIQREQSKPYYQNLQSKIEQERESGIVVFPPQKDVFNALKLTELNHVKVVILGQDPYHGFGQAHGLAFSVLPDVKIPPSLVNIYKELSQDIAGFIVPNHGCLNYWAEQGVLLLNTVLTVQSGNAHSHAKLGWETFTDAIIDAVNKEQDHVVFLLWGNHAQKKGKHIDASKHLILNEVHPSPLSVYRGFFGCRHFSKANQWLLDSGQSPIDWQIPSHFEQHKLI